MDALKLWEIAHNLSLKDARLKKICLKTEAISRNPKNVGAICVFSIISMLKNGSVLFNCALCNVILKYGFSVYWFFRSHTKNARY
jgi:hypothetical protein